MSSTEVTQTRRSAQQWIIGLAYTSIALSLLIIGTDVNTHLSMTLNSGPGVAALCILHHIIFLVISHHEEKKKRSDSQAPNLDPDFYSRTVTEARVPVVAKQWTITCIFIVLLGWSVALSIAMNGILWKPTGPRKSHQKEYNALPALRPVVRARPPHP